VTRVEINDAVRRIVGGHWRLLVVFVALGALAAFALVGGVRTYTASARLVLNTPDPTDRAAAIAIADTGNALATSPAEVTRALRDARVRGREGIAVAKHVGVRGLGTSGVLELSVSDENPKVAAAVANALAARIIQTRQSLTTGALRRALERIDEQIDEVNRRILRANVSIAGLAAGPKRDAAVGAAGALTQQRNALLSARVSLLSADAQKPQAQVISRAVVPDHADPSQRLPDTILGALLGLVLGLALAGLLETARPSIAGSDALAAEFATPLLGTFSSKRPGETADHELDAVGGRLRLAAESAGVERVALAGRAPTLDLEQLAARLEQVQRRLGDVRVHDGRAGVAPHVTVFSGDGRMDTDTTGLVLVLPTTVKRVELLDLRYLLGVTTFPLLGLITYRPSRLRSRRLRRRAAALTPQPDR
jgi:capsular polysaccharide biosynthesis protein